MKTAACLTGLNPAATSELRLPPAQISVPRPRLPRAVLDVADACPLARAMMSAQSRPRSTDLSCPDLGAPRACSSSLSYSTVIFIMSTLISTILAAQKSSGDSERACAQRTV